MKKCLLSLLLIQLLSTAIQSQIQWTTGANLADNTFGNNHPRIVTNRSGNPVIIWGRTSDASVFCSYWDGNKFSTPLKLNNNLSVATASWMGPDIASHGDTVYVVMKEIPEDQTSRVIYIVRSFDGAKTFSKPVRVDNIADSISRFPTVTTDQDGNPIVAFMKFDKSFGNSRWAVCRSNDFGNSFTKDVLASSWGNSTAICDCCPAVVTSENDNCVVVYRDNNKNIRDSWMAVSKDNAESFIGGCNVDNNRWMINQCPASGPDAVTLDGMVYSVFMSGAIGSKSLSYFSSASIANIKSNLTQSLNFNIAGLTSQNYPRISSYGNAVAIVWVQGVKSKIELPIIFTKDITKGLPTKYDTVDLLDITNADVAMNAKSIFVVWQDDNSQTIKFRSGIYNAVSTKVEDGSENDLFQIFPNPASDQLSIRSNSVDDAKLSIRDLNGKLIFASPLSKSKILDVSYFSQGIYLISLSIKDRTYVQKFIKL